MGNCMPAPRGAKQWLAMRPVSLMVAVVAVLGLAGCQLSWDIGSRQDESAILSKVSLQAADAVATARFALIPHGDEVVGQASLDLCQTEYPSEAKRKARHQVEIVQEASRKRVSSEAIAYESVEAASGAMNELAAAAAACKASGRGGGSPVIQGVSWPAADDWGLRWSFEPDPDSDWPQTPGVTRQAYSFEVSDVFGESASYVATYLRRGRILVAIYVTPPDAGAAVLVKAPSQSRLVEVMSARLASLRQSDVS